MLNQEIMQVLSTPGMTEAAQYAAGGYALKKLYDDFASPAIKEAGLLGAKIFSSLAIGLDVWAEKRKKRFMDLQNDLADNLKSKNPEDIIDTPPDYILAPAMASYMASIDKKELREMYAKLMSKALLKSYENKIHPAFATMIQSIHPDECLILHYFSAKEAIPVISTRWQNNSTSGYAHSLSHIFLYPTLISKTVSGNTTNSIETTSYQNLKLGKPMYVSNLERLGLIEVTYMEWFNDEKVYSTLIDHPLVKEDEAKCRKLGHSFEVLKGILMLTPLGMEFTNICLGDIE